MIPIQAFGVMVTPESEEAIVPVGIVIQFGARVVPESSQDDGDGSHLAVIEHIALGPGAGDIGILISR